MFSIKPTSFQALRIMSSRGRWFNPALINSSNQNSNVNYEKKRGDSTAGLAHAADKPTHTSSSFAVALSQAVPLFSILEVDWEPTRLLCPPLSPEFAQIHVQLKPQQTDEELGTSNPVTQMNVIKSP